MDFQLQKPRITPINDHVWLLNDAYNCACYVVAGADKAMVIDTMIGFVDVRREAEALTGKPLICVNTHGHSDHIGGNWAFDTALMHPADLPLVDEFLDDPEVQAVLGENKLSFPGFRPVADSEIFDLGGLELQAFHFPGHTAGEIVLLDRADRILFTGDGIIGHLWMQLPKSLPLSAQIDSLRRIRPLRGEYDVILHGHCTEPETAGLYDAMLDAILDLQAGNTAGDEDYPWHDRVSRAHPYGDCWKIVYNP